MMGCMGQMKERCDRGEKPAELDVTVQEHESRLEALPPSAKLVAKILEMEDEMDQNTIAEESLLPGRTVRYAIRRLKDADVIASRYSLSDARREVYRLQEPVNIETNQ